MDPEETFGSELPRWALVAVRLALIAFVALGCIALARGARAFDISGPLPGETPQILFSADGSVGIRSTSHEGMWGGQLWFRWNFDLIGNHYDVMFYDQTPDHFLRYFQTVNPTGTQTYHETIVYGPRDVEEFEAGSGTSTWTQVSTAGECTGIANYEWWAMPQAGGAVFGTYQEIDVEEGPCGSHAYYDVFEIDAVGVRKTMGTGWAAERLGE